MARGCAEVAFVILTWNSEKYIRACVDAIRAFPTLRTQIIVVDNGSTDGTRAILEAYDATCEDFTLVPLAQNMGTTVSRNIGIRHIADGVPYLCILDSDTIVREDAIRTMMQTLAADPKIGIVGPVMKTSAGVLQNSGRAVPTLTLKLLKVMPLRSLRAKGEAMEVMPPSDDAIIKVGYLMSACWLLRMDAVREIGLLDEAIFYAPEDVEYCLRVWTKGYKVCYDKRATIIHEWQRLSRKRLFSKHNWEHIKGLCHLFYTYGYCFRRTKFDNLMK